MIGLKDPFDDLQEAHNILIKSARRCAYDLRHAASMIDRDHWSGLREHLMRNADYWVSLFQSGNSVKEYRLELHIELDKRDREILRLTALLDAHNIEHEEF